MNLPHQKKFYTKTNLFLIQFHTNILKYPHIVLAIMEYTTWTVDKLISGYMQNTKGDKCVNRVSDAIVPGREIGHLCCYNKYLRLGSNRKGFPTVLEDGKSKSTVLEGSGVC